MVVVDGWLAEGTPHALERAGVGVEHNDAMVAIAVGDIELVALRVYPHVCRPVQVCGVGIALALVAVADLHDELAVLRELQELIVGDRLQARQAVGRAAVAADPDEALVVDMNAVLALRPFVAGAVAAPGLDVVAGLVEHHDGWRSHREVGSLRVRGRCRSQTLSCASTAKLDASPSFHLAGTFGQAASTSNIGRLRGACACAAALPMR